MAYLKAASQKITEAQKASKVPEFLLLSLFRFFIKKTGSHNYYNVYGKKHTENVGQRLLDFLEFERRGTRAPDGKQMEPLTINPT